MKSKIKLLNKNYNIRPLDKGDEGLLQQLCEDCLDYFQCVEGRIPDRDAGQGILLDLPPKKSLSDKYVLGCFNEGGKLIGVIDLVKNYPINREWIIGLMMIDPLERKNGLGRELHKLIKDYARLNEGIQLNVGVVQDNTNALKFWGNLGYTEVKRVNMTQGDKDNVVIVMSLSIE